MQEDGYTPAPGGYMPAPGGYMPAPVGYTLVAGVGALWSYA